MDKQSTDHKEETLVAMLASFRKEACYHDTFEEDFLRNFHLRKETDQAAHSAWKLLLDLGDKSTPPLQVWAQEKLTGLTIFKVDPAHIYDGQADLTPPGILKRGDKLSFASSKNETTQGIYVGMEHSIGDTSFPLRLIRAQFPKLAVPPHRPTMLRL